MTDDSSATPHTPSNGACILVVEDDASIRKVIVKIVERLGYAVETAGDGEAALAAHARHRFDAILMDCQMPKLDGFEATLAIRTVEGTIGEHTPIIALTAMTGARQKCLDAGMDDYLTKPVHPRDLKRTLERSLALSR